MINNNLEQELLTAVCINNDIHTVKYLVKKGVNINIIDNSGYTPLYYACYYEYINMIKYLVNHGALILSQFI